jgi:hypothetical protein
MRLKLNMTTAQFNRCLMLLMATFFVCSFFAAPVSAQDTETESADTQFWYQYSYQNRLSENWSFSIDSGYRNLWESKVEDVDWDRLHISSDFSYRKNSRLNFDLGSGVYYTTRSALSNLAEFRTWGGATVYWPDSIGRIRRFVLTHRFRLEQRFSRQSGTSNWDFNSRARYKLSTVIAINRKELEPGAIYAYLGGELFADLGDDNSGLVTDRNRFSIGLGWLTTKKWTVEALYTYQQNRDTAVTGDFRLTDRIVELRIKTTLKILDRMKAH